MGKIKQGKEFKPRKRGKDKKKKHLKNMVKIQHEVCE